MDGKDPTEKKLQVSSTGLPIAGCLIMKGKNNLAGELSHPVKKPEYP